MFEVNEPKAECTTLKHASPAKVDKSVLLLSNDLQPIRQRHLVGE